MRRDAGLNLLEVTVAFAIAAVIFLGIAAAISASLQSSMIVSNDARVLGQATDFMNRLRAIPYGESPDQPDIVYISGVPVNELDELLDDDAQLHIGPGDDGRSHTISLMEVSGSPEVPRTFTLEGFPIEGRWTIFVTTDGVARISGEVGGTETDSTDFSNLTGSVFLDSLLTSDSEASLLDPTITVEPDETPHTVRIEIYFQKGQMEIEQVIVDPSDSGGTLPASDLGELIIHTLRSRTQ